MSVVGMIDGFVDELDYRACRLSAWILAQD